MFNGAEGWEPLARSTVGPFENFMEYGGGIINGNVASFGIEAGARAEFDYNNWNFIVEYDDAGRYHYNSHKGILKAEYNF